MCEWVKLEVIPFLILQEFSGEAPDITEQRSANSAVPYLNT